MNVLFALYADLSSNSAAPLMLHARELMRAGHDCVVAIPGLVNLDAGSNTLPRVVGQESLGGEGGSPFRNNLAADIVHAWTPRECVRKFVTGYLARHPCPLVVYHEDNEDWISRAALSMVGLREDVLLQHSEDVISQWTPQGLSHVLHHKSFIGLADAAVVIQDKLARDVPPWVPCSTVMPGVDLEFFSPRPADRTLATRYGVKPGEKVIVYNGGLNDFTRPGMETLCNVVGMITGRGTACRLLRSGPVPFNFLEQLPREVAQQVTELGLLPREELPGILALADVLVQPGKHDPFEDLRLPGKLPEFLAMGKPVVIPETNISGLFQDGVNAVLQRSGSVEEIAAKCLALFADPERAKSIGQAGRHFAEKHFDPKAQAGKLLAVYEKAIANFDPQLSRQVWTEEATRISPSALLVRKLRALTKKQVASGSGPLLEEVARRIEFGLERAAGLEEGMAVRDRQLESQKREIATLEDEVARRGEHIVSYAQWVEDRNASIRDLEAVAAALKRDLDSLRGEIRARDEQFAALQSSLSWRITSPLRLAAGWIQKLMAGR